MFTSLSYILWTVLFLIAALIPAKKFAPWLFTVTGLAFIASAAPAAAVILLTESVLCYAAARSRRPAARFVIVILIALIAALFLLTKYRASALEVVLPLGIAYFTFRLIHYLQESARGGIREHTLVEFLAYMTFLPTYVVGPINRFPEFLLNLRRRTRNDHNLSLGLERTLYGYLQLVVLGNVLLNHIVRPWIDGMLPDMGHIGSLLLHSILLWLDLYIRFSAYSSIAIGVAAMAGFAVPENFRSPFLSRNIREFWQRWHMSLTDWCREYIFVPVAAITRRPYLAIVVTMVAIGVWHELSFRYILWGGYHSIGLIVYERWSASRAAAGSRAGIAGTVSRVLSTGLTVIFVVFSFPVTTLIMECLKGLLP